MRVGLVNDLKLALEALRRVVKSVPGYEVAWTAENGEDAVRQCVRDKPDLVLMDLIMPVMDGVEATRRIMLEAPCAILVVTATVSGNAGKVFEAMGFGALDAVSTPTLGPGGHIDGGEPLREKMATLSRLISRAPSVEAPAANPVERPQGGGTIPLVAIGASTGGPKALADTLQGLAPDIGCAVVVVQHVDRQFAPGLAEWLQSQCAMPVDLAEAGKPPQPGRIHLAASNDHLVVDADRTFRYTPHPKANAYRPSVDVFFESLLRYWPARDMAILLTGMGRDGARGLLDLRNAGWHTIAQDEASSIMYGMPKAAAELKAAVDILPPARIRAVLQRFAQTRKGAS